MFDMPQSEVNEILNRVRKNKPAPKPEGESKGLKPLVSKVAEVKPTAKTQVEAPAPAHPEDDILIEVVPSTDFDESAATRALTAAELAPLVTDDQARPPEHEVTSVDIISSEDIKVAPIAKKVETRSDIQTGMRELEFPDIEAAVEKKERTLEQNVAEWMREFTSEKTPAGRILAGHPKLIAELTERVMNDAKTASMIKELANNREKLRAHVMNFASKAAAEIIKANTDRLMP